MNLSQLEVLVAIVDSGKLTEAAEIVGLTQSAVSYSLSRLEAELGVTLLERNRQGVTVTRVGEEVVQHARAILTQMEIIRQKTARERGLTVGKLRFGCVPTIPARMLTGIIRDFQHKYPEIEIVFFEGMPQELVDWLDNNIIDVGTVIDPEGYVLTIPLVHNEIKVVVSENHAFAAQAEVDPQSLKQESMIGPKTDYGINNQSPVFQNIPMPNIRYAVSTQSTIFAMVRENMGIALIPEMLVDPGNDGLVCLSLSPRTFIDVYLAATIQSPVVDAFLRNASDWAREHGFLAAKS